MKCPFCQQEAFSLRHTPTQIDGKDVFFYRCGPCKNTIAAHKRNYVVKDERGNIRIKTPLVYCSFTFKYKDQEYSVCCHYKYDYGYIRHNGTDTKAAKQIMSFNSVPTLTPQNILSRFPTLLTFS